MRYETEHVPLKRKGFGKAHRATGFNLVMGSQENYYDKLDTDRSKGVFAISNTLMSKTVGLAVLFGNIAQDGCIVKTAGWTKTFFRFRGRASIRIARRGLRRHTRRESEERRRRGRHRHEGPRRRPGMRRYHPTSYIKSKHLSKACALITDGRFSGGTSGLSIGHISPEAAAGGNIAISAERRPHRNRHSQPQHQPAMKKQMERRRAEEIPGEKRHSPPRHRTQKHIESLASLCCLE
ncbi:MAG: dihydroxy-acid dehydratase [Bacteroides thetaiotaomicron]